MRGCICCCTFRDSSIVICGDKLFFKQSAFLLMLLLSKQLILKQCSYKYKYHVGNTYKNKKMWERSRSCISVKLGYKTEMSHILYLGNKINLKLMLEWHRALRTAPLHLRSRCLLWFYGLKTAVVSPI